MSLSDDGKLFHTDGPATENARLLRFVRVGLRTETAALVAVERRRFLAASVVKLTTLRRY